MGLPQTHRTRKLPYRNEVNRMTDEELRYRVHRNVYYGERDEDIEDEG
jgi:hypothetical protein